MSRARYWTAAICCLLAGCQVARSSSDPLSEPIAFQPVAVPVASPAANSVPSSAAIDAPPLSDQGSNAVNPFRSTPLPGVETAAIFQPADGQGEPLVHFAPEGLPPFGEPTGPSMSLDELEQMALANNPAHARAAAQVRALRGKWLQVGLPPNPTIGYRGEEIGADGSAGMQGGYFGQDLITGGKLGLNRAVAAQEIVSAQREWEAVQQRILTDARLAYYDVLVAQRRVDVAGELLGIGRRAVDASQELLAAGEIPRIGLLQTQIEAQTAQIVLQRAENDQAAAWQRLTSVVGIPNLAQTRVSGDLEGARIQFDFEQELRRILSQSPEVAAAVADVARARWAVERAYAQVVPDISTQAAVMHNTGTDFTVAGVQVALPWPLWNRNQGGIRQAQEEVVAARANVARAKLDLQQRLATAFQQYADARVQVDIYSIEILPKAKETLDLVTVGYRNEEIGYLDLLTAQRTYFQTTLSYIDSLRELWRAAVRIDGMLLDGSLQGRGQG